MAPQKYTPSPNQSYDRLLAMNPSRKISSAAAALVP